MNILDKIKEVILPFPRERGGSITRNKLSLVVDELDYAFKKSVERMKTQKSLMFHTAYVVYVPKNYYKEIYIAFGVITQEVVAMFHDELNEMLKKNKNLKFTPLFDSWSFDIISLGEDASDTPDEDNPDSIVTYEELEDKFVAVRSFPIPDEKYDFTSFSDEEIVKTNQSHPNSKFNRIQRLSIGAIRGLKPSGNGYSYPINLNGSDYPSGIIPSPSINPDPSNKTLLTLRLTGGNVSFINPEGEKYSNLDLKISHFYIGGASSSLNYNGCPMVRLDAESVLSPHFEIKQSTDGAFYMRAIGNVTQGLIPMPKDEWYRISDKNASLRINGQIEIIFNKK